MDLGERHVVVGVTGSAASVAALLWAAGEARRRGACLRVLQACQPNPVRAQYAGTGVATLGCGQESLSPAADRLDVVVRAALGDTTRSDMSTEVIDGAAERVLIEASDGADLLVLGSGGQSPVTYADPLIVDRPIGPVIRACLSHARCPVVIIGQAVAAELGSGSPRAVRSPVSARS
jgi:nucleotide-binding universal stress UspA family protein